MQTIAVMSNDVHTLFYGHSSTQIGSKLHVLGGERLPTLLKTKEPGKYFKRHQTVGSQFAVQAPDWRAMRLDLSKKQCVKAKWRKANDNDVVPNLVRNHATVQRAGMLYVVGGNVRCLLFV